MGLLINVSGRTTGYRMLHTVAVCAPLSGRRVLITPPPTKALEPSFGTKRLWAFLGKYNTKRTETLAVEASECKALASIHAKKGKSHAYMHAIADTSEEANRFGALWGAEEEKAEAYMLRAAECHTKALMTARKATFYGSL